MASPLDDLERRDLREKIDLLIKMNIALQEQLKMFVIVEQKKFLRLLERVEQSRVLTLGRAVKKLRSENAKLRKLL